MKPETIQLLKNLAYGSGVLALVVLLLWGAWHVVRVPALQLETVVVSGGETISHEQIKQDVEGLLEGEYWKFIPRRFVFTYPQQDILEALTATPRVKDPTVVRDGQQLHVTLAEFEPVALWCDGTSTTSACVFLDQNGYGFAAAPLLSGGAYTRFALVGQTASTGVVFTDAQDFAQLRELESMLIAHGWPVARIEFDQARDGFIQLVGDSELKISLRQTPSETFDNLLTVIESEQYQHFEPGNFVYVDLRFGNKVFVNEFGDPAETPDEVASTTQNAAPDDAAGE